MAGFAAGLAQGFGNFADDLAADRVRKEESDIRKATFLRQRQLDQLKQVGDIVEQYNKSFASVPDEDNPVNKALVNQRTDMFAAQYEGITGKKIDPIVLKALKTGGKEAADAMTQIYSENPAQFSTGLSNLNAFTSIYDAYNARNARIQSGEAFKSALGGGPADVSQAPGAQQLQSTLPPAVQAIDMRMANINAMAAKLDMSTDIGKERGAMLRANLDILQKQRDQLLTGQTEGMKRAAEFIPAALASQLGLPASTTYGDLQRMQGGGGAAQPSPVAPQPAIQGMTLGQRNNNPGNLRPVGKSSGFQQFNSPEEGFAALDRDLAAKGAPGRGLNTLNKLMAVYAPEGDNNNPKQYAATVAQRLGITPDTPIDLNDPVQRRLIGAQIALFEQGSKNVFGQRQQPAQPGEGPGMQGAAQPRPAAGGRSLVPPTEAEQKQSVAQAEQLQKDFSGMQQAGVKAAKRARDLETFMGVLEKSGETGTFAKSKLAFQKIAKGIGFDLPDSASYAEAAKGMAVPLYLALRDTSEGGGLPGQMVTYEEMLLQSAFPGLEKLDGANKIMADIMIRNDKRTAEVAKEIRDYVRGDKSFDGSPKKPGFADSGIFDVAEKYKQEHPIITPENVAKLQKAAGAKTGPEGGQSLIYSDTDKEARYQAYKRKQLGGK